VTKIRPATREDVPRIVEMAEQFYATTSYPGFAPLAKESAAGLAIVTMDHFLLLVVEVEGRVCGMVSLSFEPFTFNVNVTVANEIAWWMDPEVRGLGLATELLHEMEEACRAKGINVIRMALMANSPDKARILYERMGYVHTDSHFMKVLS
jgi:GNAT superfamily N-acetyltransferase